MLLMMGRVTLFHEVAASSLSPPMRIRSLKCWEGFLETGKTWLVCTWIFSTTSTLQNPDRYCTIVDLAYLFEQHRQDQRRST